MHCRPLVFVGAVLVLGLVHRSAPGATFSGPGGPIPDAASLSGPPGVVTSDVVVPDAISVQAIQVTVDDLVHTWCGDITITLTHLDTGATLALVTRIGLPLNPPPNTFGDSSNYGGVYRFADPFTLNIWTAAAAGGTSYVIPPDDYFATAAGTGFPISMLGVFGGTNAAGTWRLTITDDAAGDIGSFAGWTLEITGGEAMPCPSTGSCFIAHGSAGCDDAACCTIVCDGDASCCQTQWDADCVAAAFASCGGCGEPAAGDCCTAHATTGCADGACCAAVCSIDTFCCESQWDRGCVAEAIDLPACGCEPPLPCPAAGSCYAAHANTGCDNAACCTLVCGIDPHCCQSGWDAACANEALATCAGCGNAASGDCCSAHVGTGCDQLDCCSAVCAIDVTCCDVGWDASCADLAFTLPPCGCVLPPACGDAGTGDCCAVHANPFCDDATCCDAVCAVDPFCCQSQWDRACVTTALGVPACGCVPPPACGDAGSGDCCAVHANPFCDDATCCDAVCAIDALCCSAQWDQPCVNAAERIPACECVPPPPPCPGVGCCFGPHGSTGCNNAKCCDLVCQVDAACCTVAWDAGCANEAYAICCPGDFNDDGLVNGADLGDLLSVIGGNDPEIDFNCDGIIDGSDLGLLLSSWGPCGGG